MLRVDLGTTYTEELVIGVKMNRSKMFRSSLSAEPNSERQRYRANVTNPRLTKFNRSKRCRTD